MSSTPKTATELIRWHRGANRPMYYMGDKVVDIREDASNPMMNVIITCESGVPDKFIHHEIDRHAFEHMMANGVPRQFTMQGKPEMVGVGIDYCGEMGYKCHFYLDGDEHAEYFIRDLSELQELIESRFVVRRLEGRTNERKDPPWATRSPRL